ncbi:GM10675 [Drosophila sechellia]|uniref:GM10675 n=1 Tax=Drosophila sechellia TaxID=7238 RepID=B4I3T7_DROSE|nr:GM10675 [Drosophila sechellia]
MEPLLVAAVLLQGRGLISRAFRRPAARQSTGALGVTGFAILWHHHICILENYSFEPRVRRLPHHESRAPNAALLLAFVCSKSLAAAAQKPKSAWFGRMERRNGGRSFSTTPTTR